VGKDRRRHRVGAKVLIAVRLHLVTEVDDLRCHACDLEWDVDRPLPRAVHVLARAQRLHKLQVARRVELDQLLGLESHLLGFVVGLMRARPLAGTQRHFLQQRGRRGGHRGGRRATGGCGSAGRDLAQQVTQAPARALLRTRQSLASAVR